MVVSTFFTPLTLAATILFTAALAWRIYQLQRAPRELPVWAVAVTIAGVFGSFLCQQKAISDALDELVVRGTGRLLNNVLLSVGLCSLLIFFLGSTLGPRRYRRAAFEMIPLAAAIALMCVALAITPAEARGVSLSATVVHIPGIALFYLGAGSYLIYSLIACVWWIGRYYRTADHHLRIGLRLSGIGLALGAVGSILRALYIVVAWIFGPSMAVLLSIGIPLVILGTMLFIVGLSYPGVQARFAAFLRRRRHRRHYQQLTPLWTLLTKAYPDIVLRAGPRWPFDRLRPHNVHRRYYRRVIEIRDGLVQLSPYLETDLAAVAVDDPHSAAEELKTALTRRAGDEESGRKARLVLPGGANDIEADAQPLLALARAVELSR
jgi:hypothetical protein